VAIVRDDQSLLELSSGAAGRQAEHPWRRRAIWAVAIIAVVALGIVLFPGGFPDGLAFDAAKPLNSANEWVIEHQRSNALFVHVLVPVKNGINNSVDQLTTGLARLTWLGLFTLVVALSGYLAGWRKAVVAGIGFAAIAVLGYWADSLATLSLILVSVTVALAIGIPVGIMCGVIRRSSGSFGRCWTRCKPCRHSRTSSFSSCYSAGARRPRCSRPSCSRCLRRSG